jgi:hypothetical protein
MKNSDRNNTCQPTALYPEKLPFRNEGEILSKTNTNGGNSPPLNLNYNKYLKESCIWK